MTLFLAALGSALGILNFALKAFEVWRDRVSLQITTGRKVSSRDSRFHSDFVIRIANIGRRAAAITEIGIEERGPQRGYKLRFFEDEAPIDVFPGRAYEAHMDQRKVAEYLTSPGRPYCITADGKTHRGRFDRFFREWFGMEREGWQMSDTQSVR